MSVDSSISVDLGEVAISVRGLSKRFMLYNNQNDRLKELLTFGRAKRGHEFWALRDIAFDVRRGESIGIVGRNGSGKSTLLKLVCGTMYATSGHIKVQGQISSLLELGIGFNSQLTGRENIFLQGSIMGYSHKEMEARAEAIEEFADIGEFIHQPVKHYSSGMMVRLAFAAAINVDPDILVVDEALAVGDAKFQRKCYARIEEFRKLKKTIVLVSHDIYTIRLFCDSALMLEGGQLLHYGDPKDVTNEYHRLLFGANDPKIASEPEHSDRGSQRDLKRDELRKSFRSVFDAGRSTNKDGIRLGDGRAEIADQAFVDENGSRVSLLRTGSKYSLVLRAVFHEDLADVNVAFGIKNVKGVELFWTRNDQHLLKIPPQTSGNLLECSLQITMWLAPGRYFASFSVIGLSPFVIYDRRIDSLEFEVEGDARTKGSFVNLDASYRLQVTSLLESQE